MIDQGREDFKKYVETLISFDRYLDQLDNLNISIWEQEETGNFVSRYIELIEAVFDIPRNEYGSDLSFWLYETDCGKADNAWIEYDNEVHYIRNLDELYDWLQFAKTIEED